MTPEAGSPGLAVTSSTGVMGLAVGRAGSGVDHEIEVATERRHAEELGPLLRDLLDRAELAPAGLRWLAVDVGPGRFTGLRVGLATVRGLAFALDLPVVGLTSLEVLAAGVDGADGPVTAIIDARRQEVFQQVFAGGSPTGPPIVGRPEDLVGEARGTLLGDGFDRYRDLYLHPDAERGAAADAGGPASGTASTGTAANGTASNGTATTGLDGRHPRAADLLALAAAGPACPGSEIRPLYLRDPDAVANIRTRPEAATP